MRSHKRERKEFFYKVLVAKFKQASNQETFSGMQRWMHQVVREEKPPQHLRSINGVSMHTLRHEYRFKVPTSTPRGSAWRLHLQKRIVSSAYCWFFLFFFCFFHSQLILYSTRNFFAHVKIHLERYGNCYKENCRYYCRQK